MTIRISAVSPEIHGWHSPVRLSRTPRLVTATSDTRFVASSMHDPEERYVHLSDLLPFALGGQLVDKL